LEKELPFPGVLPRSPILQKRVVRGINLGVGVKG
jgi:hypothetical protein